MSFINKAVASAGLGVVKADIHLDAQTVCKGEQISGFIRVFDGKSEQKVTKVSLVLMAYMDFEEDDYENRKSIELLKLDIAHDIQIKPNEENKISFSFALPYDTPISFSDDMIWIEASVDCKAATAVSGRRYLQVKPHPYMQRILEILQKDLKYVLTKHESMYVPNNGNHLPIVQVFEYNATSSLVENLDELKIIFFVDDLRGLEIVLEFPKKESDSQDNIRKYGSVSGTTVQFLIPKKEFEKDNNGLIDFLLRSIRSHLGSS